jgi:acyl carrier protein
VKKSIYDRDVKCIVDVCEKDFPDIRCEWTLREDLEMDSLKLILLQVRLEDEFNHSFDPIEDDFRAIFYSIKSICQYFEDKDYE